MSKEKCEVHIFKEQNGTFSLTNTVKVKDKNDGILWLKKNGFQEIMHIKMEHDDYEYEDGIVGLYIINDRLRSVILDYKPKKLQKMNKLFNLDKAETISQPYNQYLKSNQ